VTVAAQPAVAVGRARRSLRSLVRPPLNASIVSQTAVTRRIALSALAVGSFWWTCRENRLAAKVEVKWRVIRYTEPAGVIELGWEPIKGEQPVAYVPSDRRWRDQMPDWACDRRDEIMMEIKRETTHMNFRWQEYD